MCAVRLLRDGTVFLQHWSCCGSVEHNNGVGCRKSTHQLYKEGFAGDIVVRGPEAEGIYVEKEKNMFIHECGKWKLCEKDGEWHLMEGEKSLVFGKGKLVGDVEWNDNRFFVWEMGKNPKRIGCVRCLGVGGACSV